MSDTFHKDVPDEFLVELWMWMVNSPEHTFQLLTKRSERLVEWSKRIGWTPNIWMGVTVESQDYIHLIEHLKAVDAEVKFVSFEPLLGPIDLSKSIHYNVGVDLAFTTEDHVVSRPVFPFQWAIIGGESGPGARPMKEEWVRDLIKQLSSAGVKIFYKQRMDGRKKISLPEIDGRQWMEYPMVLAKRKPEHKGE